MVVIWPTLWSARPRPDIRKDLRKILPITPVLTESPVVIDIWTEWFIIWKERSVPAEMGFEGFAHQHGNF